MVKYKSKNKLTHHFNISSKLRLSDAVSIGDYKGRVSTYIENHPLLLWNAIHKRGSKISLVRTAYCQLKVAIKLIAPHLLDDVKKKHKFYKAKRKINKLITAELKKGKNKLIEQIIKEVFDER